MKRRLFNLLTAFSLLLATTAAAAWVASYFVCVMITHVGDASRSLWAESHRGALYFTLHRTPYSIGVSNPEPGWELDVSPVDDVVLYETAAEVPVRRWIPLRLFYDVFPAETHVAAVPHWVPLLAAAALPVVRGLRRRRRAARLRSGACPSCGYDLRGSPGRCPECGAARKAEVAVSS